MIIPNIWENKKCSKPPNSSGLAHPCWKIGDQCSGRFIFGPEGMRFSLILDDLSRQKLAEDIGKMKTFTKMANQQADEG